jgi:hypothetical protein
MLAIAILESLGIALGFFFLIVPACILYTMWSVVVPARVAEHAGILASFSRSQELTSGYRWPIFGTLVVFYIGSLIAQTLTGPFIAVGAMSGGSAAMVYIGMILTALVGTVVAVASATLVACIYYELRVVKEGVGPAQIAAVFD